MNSMKEISTELVVIGDNPGGIAAALKAASSGVATILISSRRVVGGFFPSLGAIESHYRGVRSPFLQQLEDGIIRHYREKFGTDSQPYLDCVTLEPNNPMITFEPHVAEQILASMVLHAPNLRIYTGFYPVQVNVEGRLVQSACFHSGGSEEAMIVQAAAFIDASSEGDFSAIAGAGYRIGRESRAEYDESHAGKLFTKYVDGKYPQEAVEGKLNIIPKWTTRGLLPGSTGEGDDEIQDYSYRLCLSSDTDNRLWPARPDGYDREKFLVLLEDPLKTGHKPHPFHHRYLTNSIREQAYGDHLFHGHKLPNRKRSWNATNYTGAAKAYPRASREQRQAIEKKHLDHALGIMYFLQNDEAVPEDIQSLSREWGLAKDEFVHNECIPYQIYVREARRLMGRYVMKEQDFMQASGLARAPIHSDSIAIAEFALDSLPCTVERMPGSIPDGQFFLQDETRPGHVPYRSLLPQELDNVLVTETCSASHVAWGTIRQTPVLIQLGEAAGQAVALAKRLGMAPADIPVSRLQQELVGSGHMISFFNDFDMALDEEWVAAAQYLGTKGFFSGYDANPYSPLSCAIAVLWLEALRHWIEGSLDGNALALKVHRATTDYSTTQQDEQGITAAQLALLLEEVLGVGAFDSMSTFSIWEERASIWEPTASIQELIASIKERAAGLYEKGNCMVLRHELCTWIFQFMRQESRS
jgi:hypothetical protein